MSLIADEIKELRQMSKQLTAGKIDRSYVESQMKIFKETYKRSELVLKMLVSCGNPHLIESRLHSMNVISKGEFVRPAVEIEMETIQCPDRHDLIITRQECFDYSGETSNIATCKSCENFKITRRLIFPK